MNRKNQKTKNNETTLTFDFVPKTWLDIKRVCVLNGFNEIAASIEKHIDGVPPTEKVSIAVPISACVAISQACVNHNLGVGIAFITAASSHHVEKVKEKPVSSEALANARAELEGMEKTE